MIKLKVMANKNKTSFAFGNIAAEKWTLENAKEFFDAALSIAKQDNICYWINIVVELETHKQIPTYLVSKFPVFIPIKNNIDSILESKLVTIGMNGTSPTAFVIFALKNNYNWTDRTQVETTNFNIENITPRTFVKPND